QETAEEQMSESMQEFYTVLDELVGDQSVDQVRLEFEKLIQTLKKSRENEKRLMAKCRELNAEIVSSSTKVSAALQLSQDDQSTIASLKRELDKAWKMVDAANDKEKRDKDTVRTLKDEIAKLMKQAEQSVPSAEQERIQLVDTLTKERDELLTTAESLRAKLDEAVSKQQEVEAQREAALKNESQAFLTASYLRFILQLQQELQEQQNEISRETRLKEKLDKEVKKLQADMEAKAGDIRALNAQVQRTAEEQQRLEQQLKELKLLNERCSRELEQTQQKNSKLQQDLEQLSADKERLSLDNLQNTNELKRREEEVSQMRQKISKQTKMREVLQKKLHQLEEQKADVEVERDTLKVQIPALEKDLESCQKQVETDKKAVDELIRERDHLNKNLVKSTQSTEKQQNLVKLLEQDKKTLEHEISGHRQEAQRQQKFIQQLEKERDRYINETNALMQKAGVHVQQKASEVEVREKELFDWRKKVSEVECQLTQQENLLECAVKERNLYSRNLVEAQEEIAEIKRKMKTMNNQVARLRDEISGKELALAKDEQEHKRLDKDNEALKGELQLMKLQLEETKQRVDAQKTEQQNLQKMIADADAEHAQQKKQMEQIGRERDNLAKQLLQRSQERKLLYEKIKIQQSILRKGDFHYRERMEDIHLLKLEVKRLQRKKSILDKSAPNTENLRRELFHLQRELLRERTRNSVLLEQRKPINIHRWRCLEGSDPGKYELIVKIQSLQKRLIAKSQELEERELLLQEKEKLYVELKQILARQPGPEAAEQLQQYKWTLRDKATKLKVIEQDTTIVQVLQWLSFTTESQIKPSEYHKNIVPINLEVVFQALTAQVRVLDRRMSEFRCENQRLADELANIKKKYLSQKKLHRRELFHLQRELLRERTRNSVLLEQRKPINIHRWRCLEGSDPGKYELIVKIQSLQKRLIAKSQELEERELLLQEKEKLYVELKQILARQPGPEAAEQLQQYKWTLRDKATKLKVIEQDTTIVQVLQWLSFTTESQIKPSEYHKNIVPINLEVVFQALTAQVRVLDRRMSEFRCENQRLADELANIKKKYLSQKK
ncbi:unnamed protein product, partial [Tetraodon nigroviridis]